MSGIFQTVWKYWNPELPRMPHPSEFPKSPDPMSTSHVEWHRFEVGKLKYVDRQWKARNALMLRRERRVRAGVVTSAFLIASLTGLFNMMQVFDTNGESEAIASANPPDETTISRVYVNCSENPGKVVRAPGSAVIDVQASTLSRVRVDETDDGLTINPLGLSVRRVFGGTVVEKQGLENMFVAEVGGEYTAATNGKDVIVVCSTDETPPARIGQ